MWIYYKEQQTLHLTFLDVYFVSFSNGTLYQNSAFVYHVSLKKEYDRITPCIVSFETGPENLEAQNRETSHHPRH